MGIMDFRRVPDQGLPARLQETALNATYVPKWKASTAYSAGDMVTSPAGDVVTAKSSFASGATYDAANWSKSNGVINVKDFGAKGTGAGNDTAAINAAIAAMQAGDTLYFPPGRYNTNGGHVFDKPSIKVVGSSGRAQTYNSSAQLYLLAGSNADMFTAANNQQTYRDISLFGNYSNQTGASRGFVTPSTGSNYILLDAVWVDSFNGDGFYFSSGSTISSTVVNCESRKNRGYGMNFQGTATDSMVANCYIDQNWQSGVFCSAGDLSLTSVHIWGNGNGNTTGDRDGITFQSASGCRVINCYIETQQEGAGIRFKSGNNKGHIIQGCDIWANGYQGIYGFGASNCVVTGNVIRQNNYKGNADIAGILWDSCTAMNVTGNMMFSSGTNRQHYGYRETGTANADCLFVSNTSRAVDHNTGNWVVVTGTAKPTLVANNIG